MNMICHAGRFALSALLVVQLIIPAGMAAAMESRALQVESLKKKAALWVLTIGVSDYADPRISLQYADNDAIQIANAMQTQQGVLFREVFTRVLVNEQATRGEILREMSQFIGQAASDDVVLVFMAGHGLQDRQTGTYYFVPHNANAENLAYEGLPMPMFDEAVKRIRANVNKVILWMDTCHAGAMTVASRGVNSGEDLAEALAEATGQYVLSASKAGEESLEDASFSFDGESAHGAFTYSLLRGLSGAAADSTGVVWLSDLFGHVSREVPRLTTGRQHPHSQTIGTNLPLFVLADAALHQGTASVSPTTIDNSVLITRPSSKGGSKKWLWLLLGVAAAGGGAAVTLGGGPTGTPGPTAIEPPPDHP